MIEQHKEIFIERKKDEINRRDPKQERSMKEITDAAFGKSDVKW